MKQILPVKGRSERCRPCYDKHRAARPGHDFRKTPEFSGSKKNIWNPGKEESRDRVQDISHQSLVIGHWSISTSSFFVLRHSSFLLPLNGPGGLGGDIVNNPVDAFHAVDNAVGYTAQTSQGIWTSRPSWLQGLSNAPDGDNMFISPFVSHDAYRLHGKEHGKRLPHFFIEPG